MGSCDAVVPKLWPLVQNLYPGHVVMKHCQNCFLSTLYMSDPYFMSQLKEHGVIHFWMMYVV